MHHFIKVVYASTNDRILWLSLIEFPDHLNNRELFIIGILSRKGLLTEVHAYLYYYWLVVQSVLCRSSHWKWSKTKDQNQDYNCIHSLFSSHGNNTKANHTNFCAFTWKKLMFKQSTSFEYNNSTFWPVRNLDITSYFTGYLFNHLFSFVFIKPYA